MFTPEIKTSDIESARNELNLRKENNPKFLHTLKYADDRFTIKSVSVECYVDSIVRIASGNYIG